MSVRQAFDIYFEEMNRNWLEKRGCMPQIPCREKDKERYGCLVVGESNQTNYVLWKPQLQTIEVDFQACEKDLGFEIHPQIKDFVSTYWFAKLEGVICYEGVRVSLQLNGLLPCYDIQKYVIGSFDKSETHYVTTGEYFLLGSYCSYDGNDGYLVQVDNATGEVYMVQVLDKVSIKIANSIEELLMTMKGIWS